MSLPNDIWRFIFSYLRGYPVRQVCRKWRDLHKYEKLHISCMVTRIETLKWAFANAIHARIDKKVCAHAAQGGHLEVLKWAKAYGCPWNESTCVNAAKNGHLEVLKWALTYYVFAYTRGRMVARGICGHVPGLLKAGI